MPISPIILQRRHAELGRIRLGAKRGGNGAPMKLEQFRFTSPSQTYINDLAELYGGTPQPWDNNGKAEFEVYTTAVSVPVIAVKGGLSQWMETWSGGGCVHRCDGETNALTNELCDPNDRAHQQARPTTRLSVMLPELDAIGVWRMESHGWNAAAEIPAVAELAQFVGDLVPAELHLMERRKVKDGKTSRFVVPVLDLRIGQARLREVVEAKSGAVAELAGPPARELAGGQAPALAAPTAAAAPVPDFRAAAAAATDLEQVRRIWGDAQAAGAFTPELQAFLTERGNALQAQSQAAAPAPAPAAVPAPDEQGIFDADIVDDQASEAFQQAMVPTTPTADAVWEQIVRAAGQQGLGLADLQDAVQTFLNIPADQASAEELGMYLTELQGRAA